MRFMQKWWKCLGYNRESYAPSVYRFVCSFGKGKIEGTKNIYERASVSCCVNANEAK